MKKQRKGLSLTEARRRKEQSVEDGGDSGRQVAYQMGASAAIAKAAPTIRRSTWKRAFPFGVFVGGVLVGVAPYAPVLWRAAALAWRSMVG